MRKKTFLHFILSCVLVSLFLASCSSQEKLIYLQFPEKEDNGMVLKYAEGEENFPPIYLLSSKDRLHINISSATNPESNQMFLQSASASTITQTELSVFLNSYSINQEGFISLPIIGQIHVAGKTVSEVKKLIETKVAEFVSDPIVSCNISNYRITILGDVNRPGTYSFYQDHVNIFQAISQAGDLSKYGNRAKIKIVRKGMNTDLCYFLNLRDITILSDPKFYLLPGDIIYVEPNQISKAFQIAEFPWSVLFSTISTLSTIITLFVALKKK